MMVMLLKEYVWCLCLLWLILILFIGLGYWCGGIGFVVVELFEDVMELWIIVLFVVKGVEGVGCGLFFIDW